MELLIILSSNKKKLKRSWIFGSFFLYLGKLIKKINKGYEKREKSL